MKGESSAGAGAPGRSEKILFWASFFTLIAAGMGMAIRGDILADWGHEFGFTQTELGEITGMGLMGFGLTIIFFSFFADLVGYGKLMIIAWLLHVVAVLTTLAAPFVFATAYGKMGAYWCLYIGQFAFSLGNGTCEAVINPLTATLFPRNRTHWLNILHAGWPGGLVLGALVGWVCNHLPGVNVGWTVRWGIVLTPMLLYGLMMLGRRFPTSEAKEHGVRPRDMMGELGALGALVATVFVGIWLSKDLIPALPAIDLGGWVVKLPGWLGWLAALVLWSGFGLATAVRPGEGRPLLLSLGHVMLAFLLVIHAMVGYVELGTDNWIQDITKTVVIDKNTSLIAFAWTNILMFGLRFFAGPIVHKISPVGLLFCSAVLGTAGLILLGLPATDTAWLWLGAVTVYGIGKTFYWPTMLGVISERFPRGGALALGFSGGVGMLSAGILGGPLIGYEQDYAVTRELERTAEQTYDRYKADKPSAPLPMVPDIAGLDNGKVGVLMNYEDIQKAEKTAKEEGRTLPEDATKLRLQQDIDLLATQGKTSEELQKRLKWWESEGKPYAALDYPKITDVRVQGGKTALTWTAGVPATMAVCYLLLIIYFSLRGGYKVEVLVGHQAEDEKFTGGTEGPGEG
ncbi:MAG TPA: MFS transporter [Gemmataceae bacterium]|nr:MFS transporter [Gemmataceae bacterium]